MRVEVLRASGDNYIYIVVEGSSAVVVDPSEAGAVLKFAENRGLHIEAVLVTHHHFDHTAGCRGIRARTGASIVAPAASSVSPLDRTVSDGDSVVFGESEFRVMAVPGHTADHVVYYSAADNLLFTGDLLFVGGCGRIFEGTASEMWCSLQKVASLPDDTLTYCGHEYTVENLQFALHIEPDNIAARDALKDIRLRLRNGEPSVPSTIGAEKQINPFLRAGTASVRTTLSLPDASVVKVFSELRCRKNVWQ